MKHFVKIMLVLCAIVISCRVNAQLIANAGNDTTVCTGSLLVLNGSAHGGIPPYQFYWDSNPELSCYHCSNPTVETNTGNGYGLTVIDAAHDTAKAWVYVSLNALPRVNITVSDTVICTGQQIYLQGSTVVSGCGTGGACTSNNVSTSIGNGTTSQPGSAVAYPSIFGNFQHSCRQLLLIKASELGAALGGAVTINSIGFALAEFNTNAYMQNFTIKMGCLGADSLNEWDDNLVTVLNPTSISPSVGWTDFTFNSNFYWDGVSNIVIEVCSFNPLTYGNQNNKAQCTLTAFSSYIYSAGNRNQCDSVTTPIASNIRPNIHFGYCAASPAFTYQWLPSTGADGVTSPTTNNTYANPVNSTTYYLGVTDGNGCLGKDSINIMVRPASVSVNVKTTNAICTGQASGVIMAGITANDTVHYQLLDSNYSATLHSGSAINNDTLLFTGLAAGTYHLLLSDSLCTNIDNVIVVGDGLLIADTSSTNPTCPSLSDGVIRATLFGHSDSLNYKLLNFNSTAVLDSGEVKDSGTVSFTSLVAGTYPLIISDSLCTKLYDITILAPSRPNYTGNSFSASCYGDSTASGCVNISGGTPPLHFTWSDPAITGACPVNVPAGNFTLTVTDAGNCSTVISNIIVQQNPEITAQQIGGHPWYNSDSITLYITGGTSPYTLFWGDSSSTQANNLAGHWYSTASAFAVLIEDAQGCYIYDTINTVFIIGIHQGTGAGLKIFPNPATDQLFIESNEISIDEIEVLDITGKQVLHQYLSGAHQSMLNVSELSNGVYLLNTRAAGLEHRNRFVKVQ